MRTADSIAAQESQREAKEPARAKTPHNTPGVTPEQLKPYLWKIGCASPNPSGRPKRDFSADFARMVMEAQDNPEMLQQYASGFSSQLQKGNAYTFKELAERGYGKLVQRNEVTGKDGGALEFKDMSNADLDARVKELEIELGYASAIDEAGGDTSNKAGETVKVGEAKD